MIYIFGALSVVICVFLISLSIQLLRIEKSLTEISFLVENRVGNLFKAGE